MKIGILTFHSQLNYGGVLQAFASRTFLTARGHDVRFARACEKSQVRHRRMRMVLDWCTWLLRGGLRGEDFARSIRCRRTFNFIRASFPEIQMPIGRWKERQDADNIDVVLIGSDQVWNSQLLGKKNVENYLPRHLRPLGIRQLAYAVSVGMLQIPEEDEELFRNALPHFAAVSVREAASLELLWPYCQKSLAHVCDPTLLLSKEEWVDALELAPARPTGRVFLYALDLNDKLLKMVGDFSRRTGCAVDVYTESRLTTMPRTIRGFWQLKRRQICLLFSRVRIRRSAGPREFIQGIRGASCVMADSFHALMFATIFEKPVRIVIDKENGYRVKMSARIREFMAKYYEGLGVVDSWGRVLADTFLTARLCQRRELQEWIEFSKRWLLNGLTDAGDK